MQAGGFSGKFLRPTESYSVQDLGFTQLNRVGVEVLYALLIVVIAALVIHFIVSARSASKRGEK